MAQVIKRPNKPYILQEGEEALFHFLRYNLDKNWTIHVQPFLNGYEPDFIVANPRIGILIFEVKDYSEGLYRIEKNDRWFVRTRQGVKRILSPLQQIKRYRNNIINLYCPGIGRDIDKDSQRLGVIRQVLYFHKMDSKTIEDAIHENLRTGITILGKNDLKDGVLHEKFVEIRYGRSLYMQTEWLKCLESWIKPPIHLITHGRNGLHPQQKRHAIPAPGRHRLKGVAGSGKSLVLAHRAAARSAKNERVLVLTYNITLANNVRSLMYKAEKFHHDRVIVTHFHEFCLLVLHTLSFHYEIPRDNGRLNNFFEKQLPDMVEKAIANGVPENLRFDGIYIDEAQDFHRNWFELCTKFLRSEQSEIFIAMDHAQNLYDRKLTWTEDMRGLGFRGPWANLKQCYRLPHRIRKAAWNFAVANGLDTEQLLPPESQQKLFNPPLCLCTEKNIREACRIVLRTYHHLMVDKQAHPQDIVILVPTHKIGEAFVDYLQRKGDHPNHVFNDRNDDHRGHKKTFEMNHDGVKICTIHSFKGWESLYVILLLADESFNRVKAKRMFYVALTRCLKEMYIVDVSGKINMSSIRFDPFPKLKHSIFRDFLLDFRKKKPIDQKRKNFFGDKWLCNPLTA